MVLLSGSGLPGCSALQGHSYLAKASMSRSEPWFLTLAFEAPATQQGARWAASLQTIPWSRRMECSDSQGLFPTPAHRRLLARPCSHCCKSLPDTFAQTVAPTWAAASSLPSAFLSPPVFKAPPPGSPPELCSSCPPYSPGRSH